MTSERLFVMAGGGTGGHVIPAIAVAREVCRMGYRVLFVGTERGVENRLVPAAGFRLEKIRVGGLKNLGIATRVLSLRSEEHTSELQSRRDLVCRLLLEKKKKQHTPVLSSKKNKQTKPQG